MNTNRIDIIIPVYNVEPYLRRCLNSILKHTDIGVPSVLMMALQTDVLLSLKSMLQKTLALWWFIKKMVDSLMLEMKVWLSPMLSMLCLWILTISYIRRPLNLL